MWKELPQGEHRVRINEFALEELLSKFFRVIDRSTRIQGGRLRSMGNRGLSRNMVHSLTDHSGSLSSSFLMWRNCWQHGLIRR